MAVLVEGISVVIRRDAITEKIEGGWQRFLEMVPNQTLCNDVFLARVGFMSPMDVQSFCNSLEKEGLVLVEAGHFTDMAVVDQRNGPTLPCDWLQFRHVEFFNPPMKVAAAELLQSDEPGVPEKKRALQVSFPRNWKYENSLSQKYQFTPLEEITGKYQFLRHENGIDVLLDRETGKVVYRARIS